MEFVAIETVTSYVTVKNSILDDDDVICNVQAGDVLLLRHPDKLHLSFHAQASQSKFFMNMFYSTELTGDIFVNADRCTDQGAHLGDLNNLDSNSGGSVSNTNADPSSSPNSNV